MHLASTRARKLHRGRHRQKAPQANYELAPSHCSYVLIQIIYHNPKPHNKYEHNARSGGDPAAPRENASENGLISHLASGGGAGCGLAMMEGIYFSDTSPGVAMHIHHYLSRRVILLF